jgi:hypothetical protein
VARAFGVTSASVCQYLTLLRRLPPELLIQAEIERDQAKLKRLTLRKLLEVSKVKAKREPARRVRGLLGKQSPSAPRV